MARRSFDVFDLIELFTHWHAGRSQRQLAESLGIDRKTIAKYLAPAIAESLTPGGEPVTEAEWAALIARWFPEVADPGLQASTWPCIELHRERISDWLKAEVSAATVAQRLRDEHGVASSESSVRRWISANLAEEAAGEGDRGTRAGRSGQRSPDRLRPARDVVRSGQRSTGDGVGVRDGVGLLAAHLRAAGAQDAPILLVRFACRGVRVLRRCPRQAGPGQLEDRCGAARSV